mmetsp:Transcript_46163/g.51459  ORF Transcript_46163/g.51459 Transcript_46163/m.51459 type:complete len:124 (+) Transcript_46163:80-451(+)
MHTPMATYCLLLLVSLIFFLPGLDQILHSQFYFLTNIRMLYVIFLHYYHPSSASFLILSLSSSVISNSFSDEPPDSLKACSSWLVSDPRSSKGVASTSSISPPAIFVDILSDNPPPRSTDRSP